jgi:hypothetical protein
MLRDIILGQKSELEKVFGQTYIKRDIKQFSLEHDLVKVVMGPSGLEIFFCATFAKAEG